jgi:E-phenylitaconyl-CoA hydratase
MQTNSEVLKVEVRNSVALLTLNRPEARNAMNRELRSALSGAWERVRDDDEIRVAVLTGNGQAFSAGADLKERAAGNSQNGGPRSYLVPDSTVVGVSDVGKPVIAAINGFCFAGALELALSCDMRFASRSATLGLTEITHGFFPGGGGPQRLMRQLPHAVALDLLLTGDRIDADQAFHMGIVSRLYSDEDLLPSTMEVAERIASYAPLAVRALREVAYAAPDLPLDRALRYGSSLRWMIAQTADAKEGPRAFADKRKPEYRGE